MESADIAGAELVDDLRGLVDVAGEPVNMIGAAIVVVGMYLS